MSEKCSHRAVCGGDFEKRVNFTPRVRLLLIIIIFSKKKYTGETRKAISKSSREMFFVGPQDSDRLCEMKFTLLKITQSSQFPV